MGKCCPGTHETFTHDGYMSPMMGICRHGYMSHGYMSPNHITAYIAIEINVTLEEMTKALPAQKSPALLT